MTTGEKIYRLRRQLNLTQEQLGKKIGKSQAAIANKIRLLNLPPNIKEALTNNKISEHHARSLLKVKDPEEQDNLLKRIIKKCMIYLKDTAMRLY